MSFFLSSPLSLLRANRYARPASGADILPDVYGDFRTGGGLRGPCPAVLVDTTNFIYVAAAHSVVSIDQVFIDDVEQSSGFTVNVAYDLESLGEVAVIDFTSLPDGQVSWRGRGKPSGGSLITGALDQIEDLIKTRADGVTADFNAASLAEAKAAADSEGYTPAWVIQDLRELGEWLTEMLFNVCGRYRIAGDGRLEFMVDTGLATYPMAAHVVASRDCVDGDDGVEFLGDYQHIVNALTVLYQWSFALGAPSVEDATQEHAVSKNLYGETRKIITLRGLRTAAEVATWADTIFTRSHYRSRVEGARVRFTVDGARCAHVTQGDYLSLSWDWGPYREEAALYRNEILQVLGVQHQPSPARLRTTITALDTGVYLTTDPYFDAAVDFDADVVWGGDRSTVLQP